MRTGGSSRATGNGGQKAGLRTRETSEDRRSRPELNPGAPIRKAAKRQRGAAKSGGSSRGAWWSSEARFGTRPRWRCATHAAMFRNQPRRDPGCSRNSRSAGRMVMHSPRKRAPERAWGFESLALRLQPSRSSAWGASSYPGVGLSRSGSAIVLPWLRLSSRSLGEHEKHVSGFFW